MWPQLRKYIYYNDHNNDYVQVWNLPVYSIFRSEAILNYDINLVPCSNVVVYFGFPNEKAELL